MPAHNCPWCRDEGSYELESANGGTYTQHCEHCQPHRNIFTERLAEATLVRDYMDAALDAASAQEAVAAPQMEAAQ